MKIKNGFVLREVSGSFIVIATGEAAKSFNGIINLNETGAFLWKQLEKGTDEQGLVQALLSEYEIDKETAERDVSVFVNKLTEEKLI